MHDPVSPAALSVGETPASRYSGGSGEQTGQSKKSRGSSGSHTSHESQEEMANVMGENIMEFQLPEWIKMIMDCTGIATLQYELEVERLRRADEFYQNPHPFTNSIVSSLHFEVFVGGVICLNGLTLGIEASGEASSGFTIFTFFEYVFSIFFFFEWTMRMLAFGWSWIFELSNACDTVLVFGSGAFLKIVGAFGVSIDGFRMYTALRFLRLVRLARAVRLMPMFREAWILINGLTTSMQPLFWVAVIAIAVLYVFAVGVTELVGRNSKFKDDPYAMELFGDLTKSMFTLLQLITLDTWNEEIARPTMDKEPFWLPMFYITFVGVGVFVFWNLITAIVVDSAFKIAKEDAAQQAKEVEDEKKLELKGLADLFMEIDKDKSGQLSKEEFMTELDNKRVVQMLDLLELKKEEIMGVWNVLDDGDGELTIKEFTNGIRRMKGIAKAKDMVDCVKRLRLTTQTQEMLKVQSDRFCASLQVLEENAAQLAVDTDEILGLFVEMQKRLVTHVDKGRKEDRQADNERKKIKLAQQMEEHQEKMAAEAAKNPPKTTSEDGPPPEGTL